MRLSTGIVALLLCLSAAAHAGSPSQAPEADQKAKGKPAKAQTLTPPGPIVFDKKK